MKIFYHNDADGKAAGHIAIKYGGGGHPRACRFETKILPFKKKE